nr:unnamed protein product [Callosobruchus chinensis]
MNSNKQKLEAIAILEHLFHSLVKYRPHKCFDCGKSYTMKGNLRRHQKVECGKEKSLKCIVCPSRFYYKQEIIKHMRMRHGIHME